MADITDDVYGSYHFLLELGGVNDNASGIVAGFTSISGGGLKIEKRDVTTGNSVRREYLPGPCEFENLCLVRGLTTNQDLLDWIDETVEGKDCKRDGAVILLDNDGEEIRRWSFFGAFPVSWGGVELSSDGSAIMLEKVEIHVSKVKSD